MRQLFYFVLCVSSSLFLRGFSADHVLEEIRRQKNVRANNLITDSHDNLTRRRRQYANLPNGAACLGNLDCASGCCLVHYEFAGVCVVRALPGQICGLLSYVALGPPVFFGNDPDFDNNWRRKRDLAATAITTYSQAAVLNNV